MYPKQMIFFVLFGFALRALASPHLRVDILVTEGVSSLKSSPSPCCDLKTCCKSQPDSTTIPYGDHCDQFISCYDNEPYISHCIPPYKFNADVGDCDDAKKVDCDAYTCPKDGAGSAQPFNTQPGNPGSVLDAHARKPITGSTSQQSTPPKNQHTIIHSTTSGSGSDSDSRYCCECAKGLEFDPDDLKCDTPSMADCVAHEACTAKVMGEKSRQKLVVQEENSELRR